MSFLFALFIVGHDAVMILIRQRPILQGDCLRERALEVGGCSNAVLFVEEKNEKRVEIRSEKVTDEKGIVLILLLDE